MPTNFLSDALVTLVTNGFNIRKVDRPARSNDIVHAYKYDKLGAKINYIILFTEDSEENAIFESLLNQSTGNNSTLVLVSDKFNSSKYRVYKKKEFFDLFGGIVNTGLTLILNLSHILDELGHNKVPTGLVGKAPDLHEMYVAECLRFIMESPTRRYGIDRSFESLPDVVVLSKEQFMLLLDSKSYENGFDFQANDIRTFSEYVEDFRQRYSMFGRILSLVVVSGHFNDSDKSLAGRSEKLLEECQCRLSCLESKELGKITQFLRENPQYRNSIRWKKIFSNLKIDMKLVEKEITRLKKDNLV